MNIIIEAAQFANQAHQGYLRKYTGDPYIYHPMRVAGMVSMMLCSTEEMVAAAWLHDVAEDTKFSISDIKRNFNDEIATMVSWLTNGPHNMMISRAMQKEKDREKLSKAPNPVKIIKLCDSP